MSDQQHETAQYDRASDAGKPPKGIVTRWCKEIELAGRTEEAWRKKAQAVVKRFRDEEQLEKGTIKSRKLGTKFNILRPNTRVMKAAIYQDPPKPDVRRRFKDRDPLGKAVSEVTERALSFCMDKYDFDGAMNLAVNDQLLPGRGVTRVRYEPQFMQQAPMAAQPGAQAPQQPMEQIVWEKCCFKHVNWEDFRRGPGRTWPEVPWVAFRWRLTRDEAIKEMPRAEKLLETIDLDCSLDMTDEDQRAVKDNPDLADVFKRLTVWEVWDKTKREVLFIAPSHKDEPLDTRPDPLGLEDFFDIPRPLYAVEESDTLIPLEDFRAYADQAKELDNITARIDGIVAQLKVRGLYDATLKQMADVMSSDDGKLIPAEEVAALYNMGGLEKAIWLMPIDKIAQVLQYLYEHREQTKQIIYEITGLSDIMRGSSKASETATAQSIKAQNGAISIQDRRKAVKRYGRDQVRIAAEIICEHFQPETLKAMTGSDYPTEQEKQQIQMQLQQAQQQMQQQAAMQPPPVEGQPVDPAAQPAGPPPEAVALMEQAQQRLAMPSWEQIVEVMRDDKLRSYKIDVETDETAFGDQAAEQQAVTELLTSATGFLTAMAPLVQGGVVPPEVAKTLLMFAVRRFKAGREVEDALEELGEGPMPPPVDPNAGKIDIEKQKLEQGQTQHDQTMAFNKEKHAAEMARAAKQDEAAEAKDTFAKQQHTDDLTRRDQEFAFQKDEAVAGRAHAENLAKMKQQPAANIMLGSEGKVVDMAESTQGVAAAVQAMTDVLQQLLTANAAAEQQQAMAIQNMGQQIGQALLAGLTAPKRVKRDNKGKISAIVPANEGMQ
jgi:hypothetical protein